MAKILITIQDRDYTEADVKKALYSIEKTRVWLLEQEAKYVNNPQVARTFQESRQHLEKCGLWK